jgi:hypothetical protein
MLIQGDGFAKLRVMQMLLRLRRGILLVLLGEVKAFIYGLINCWVRAVPDDAELV